MILAGTRSPTELAGREPALPGAAAAAPPRLVAKGAGLQTGGLTSLGSRGPRKPPAPQAQKCLPSLPGARSAAEQSCRRVPIAKPRHCRDPAGSARSRSAADTPAPPPPLPRSRPPLETASEAKTLGRGAEGGSARGRGLRAPLRADSLGAADGM